MISLKSELSHTFFQSMIYNNVVETKNLHFTHLFKIMGLHPWWCCRCRRGPTVLLKGVQVYGRRRGSYPQTNNYLDDVFKLKDLLDLEKNIAKALIENFIVIDLFQVPNLKWKRQLAMIEIPTISFILFSLLFTQPFNFRRDRNRNAATLLFCVIPVLTPCIEYIEIWVDNFQ